MNKTMLFLVCVTVGFSSFLIAHNGHEVSPGIWQENSFSWLHWIGKYHYVFVHFPIALIVMTVITEGLAVWTEDEIYSHAARVMIISAALWAVPTALLGLALGFDSMYEGATGDIFVWHRALGIGTALLAILTVFFRERHLTWPYYISLTILFTCLCWATILGGILTFNF